MKHHPLPPLPREIQGMSGLVTVVRPAQIRGGKLGRLDGLWLPEERRILIPATHNRPFAWGTFLHELIHVAETDSGYYLPEPRMASVHTAIASQLMHVIRHFNDLRRE